MHAAMFFGSNELIFYVYRWGKNEKLSSFFTHAGETEFLIFSRGSLRKLCQIRFSKKIKTIFVIEFLLLPEKKLEITILGILSSAIRTSMASASAFAIAASIL